MNSSLYDLLDVVIIYSTDIHDGFYFEPKNISRGAHDVRIEEINTNGQCDDVINYFSDKYPNTPRATFCKIFSVSWNEKITDNLESVKSFYITKYILELRRLNDKTCSDNDFIECVNKWTSFIQNDLQLDICNTFRHIYTRDDKLNIKFTGRSKYKYTFRTEGLCLITGKYIDDKNGCITCTGEKSQNGRRHCFSFYLWNKCLVCKSKMVI